MLLWAPPMCVKPSWPRVDLGEGQGEQKSQNKKPQKFGFPQPVNVLVCFEYSEVVLYDVQ